jgi:cell division protease FtsH
MYMFFFSTALVVLFFVNICHETSGFKIRPVKRGICAPLAIRCYMDPGDNENKEVMNHPPRYRYPLSKNYYENYVKRLNSQNMTVRDTAMMQDSLDNEYYNNSSSRRNISHTVGPNSEVGLRIILTPNGGYIQRNDISGEDMENTQNEDNQDESEWNRAGYFRKVYSNGYNSPNPSHRGTPGKKSENFEVITDFPLNFTNVGGYDNVKTELIQCVDILSNYTKYKPYNVRIPKGLIFEGPPGNGKTMLAKALAGEAKIPFISVSGAQFQEKYVGVGSSRIRELFKLASDSCPVIVFIDEIDALGRARSGDGESSSSERDNTLNELLVAMDGFGSKDGIFVVGATNRADLLDPALTRPGRIDKRIYIGNPDAKTRQCVIAVHIDGKPYEDQLDLSSLVENTNGLSGAQIENLLNEAMLTAIRENREEITQDDIDVVLNKMMVGWQPTEHEFTSDIIDHIAIHEMGHAIVGIMSKHHSKVTKVMINLNAPQSPGYTVFETTSTPIYTREALFEHLMILLGGRVAEEVFYQTSVTTGAINDFEEALKLAEKMITYYGMGSKLIYPKNSEKYKNIVDEEVFNLIEEAYTQTEQMMNDMKVFVKEASEVLKDKQLVTRGELLEILARVAPDTVDMTSFMELE